MGIEAVTSNKLPATAAVTTEEVGLWASPVVQPLVGPALPPLATPLTSTLYASLDQAHSRSVGPAPDPRLLKQRPTQRATEQHSHSTAQALHHGTPHPATMPVGSMAVLYGQEKVTPVRS